MKQEYPYFGRKYGPKDPVRPCRTCGEDIWVRGLLTAIGYKNEKNEEAKFNKRFEEVQPQKPVAQAVAKEPPAYVAAEEAPVSVDPGPVVPAGFVLCPARHFYVPAGTENKCGGFFGYRCDGDKPDKLDNGELYVYVPYDDKYVKAASVVWDPRHAPK